MKRTFIVFIPLLILSAIVRLFQLNYAVDFNTGFYFSDAGFLASLLYVVYVVGFVLVIFSAVLDRKAGECLYSNKPSGIHPSDAGLLGVMFIIAAASVAYSLISGAFTGFGILGAVAGLMGYISIGGVLLTKKRVGSAVGFLMLLPTVSFTVRLVVLFVGNLILTHISDYLIKLIAAIFAVLFFLSAGRIFSGAEGRFTRLRCAVSGLATLGLILSETTAKVIFWLTSPNSVRQNLNLPDMVFLAPNALDVAECIVIFLTLFVLLKKPSAGGEENES